MGAVADGGQLFVIVCRVQRAKPVIIDPGLYMKKKADVFWIPQRRSVPTAFKLFTGKDTMLSIRLTVKIICHASVHICESHI
jgi:hypothetical protein